MRKFIRVISLGIVLMLALLCLGGCSKGDPSTPVMSLTSSDDSTNISTNKNSSTKEGINHIDFVSSNISDKYTFLSSEFVKLTKKHELADSANSFGFDIFKEAVIKDKGSNIIISPLSMFTAFSLLSNGTAGETKTQMRKVMHVDSYDDKTLNEEINQVISNLGIYRKNNNSDFDIGFKNVYNFLWINKDFEIKDSFIELSKKYYNSDIFKADFSSEDTVTDMNNWISSKTDGFINKPIGDIDASMQMTLFNVLHFK